MGRALAGILAVLWAWPLAAEQIHAFAPYVIDGDTLVVDRQRVRLQNVDAPELDQPGGREAREHLRQLVKGRAVACQGVARDRYKRLVATCTVGGVDLGEALIAAKLGKPHVRPRGVKP
jgi:endonuclease YncB( thermonuclease family)